MSQTFTPASFIEQDFYLKEFCGKSLFFSLRAEDLRDTAAVKAMAEVCQQLTRNETRLIVLIETDDSDQPGLELLRIALAARFVALPAEENSVLEHIWTVLRTTPIFVGLWPAPQRRTVGPVKAHRPRGRQDDASFGRPGVGEQSPAQRLAVRLKVHKLVILDPNGGLCIRGNRVSFMNGAALNKLLDQSRAAGTPPVRTVQEKDLGVLASVRAALEGGVASVSLCRPADVAGELFTYEGQGTLFTLTDYCRLEPLGLDDFYEAERLIRRGERDGGLKPRSHTETSQLLFHGHCARLGAAGGELAGVCALLPYPRKNAAEIAGLYTITRFQGEGIGGRLVGTMLEQARAAGLGYVFACTSQAGARRLFERSGFRRVTAEQVPAEKWRHYDPARKKTIGVYRIDI